MESHSASYAAAGVNIQAGYEGVRLMKKHVERTSSPVWSPISAALAGCSLRIWPV